MCITTNSEGHVFIGTGHPQNGSGVYRSTNFGQSWEVVYNAGPFMVQSIASTDDGDIYVGKTGPDEFMVSENNGDTWEAIDLPFNGNIMKIFPSGEDTLYVSRWENNGALLLRSANGGITWDSLFSTIDHPGEYISDIAISTSKDIFVSLMCYSENMGGVYKTTDNGVTWEFIGLLNHQVMTIEINSNDDVFTGDWFTMLNEVPGVYAIYSGMNAFELIHQEGEITEILINSEGFIYATTYGGVVVSTNNGNSFEYIDQDISRQMNLAHLDHEEFIYIANQNYLARSKKPTVGVFEYDNIERNIRRINIYPNPANIVLNVTAYPELTSRGTLAINIYDATGKLVAKYESTLQKKNLQIDVSDLESGIYLIHLFGNDINVIEKFSKR
jgi:hypothetical protein